MQNSHTEKDTFTEINREFRNNWLIAMIKVGILGYSGWKICKTRGQISIFITQAIQKNDKIFNYFGIGT